MDKSSPDFPPLMENYSSQLTPSLLGRMSIALVTLDQTFTLHQWNSGWVDHITRLVPSSANQMAPGLNLFELLPGLEAPLRPLLERALTGEKIHQETLSLDVGDRKVFWEVGVELTIANEKTYLLAIILDATDHHLARRTLEQKIARQTDELSTVLKVANSLVSLEVPALLELLLDQLKSVIDCDGVAIMTLRNEVLTVTAYRGPVPPDDVLGGQFLVDDAALSRQIFSETDAIIVQDINADTDDVHLFRQALGDKLESVFGGMRCWMAVPMIFKRQITGVLGLQHRRPDYYTAHHAELALTFASFAAIALENDRVYQKIRWVATLEERNRLAQELHDNIAQALGFLNLKAATTRTLLVNGELEEAEANLRELKQIVGDTYTDVREEIFNLRGKDMQGLSFVEMVQKYIAKYKTHYGLDVKLILDSDEAFLNFPANIGNQVIRIIQEALINVRKHANVNSAILRFRRVDHEMHITIEDAGRGFEPSAVKQKYTSGFGLQIMAERAESVGGRLKFDTSPGAGAKVIIRIPIVRER